MVIQSYFRFKLVIKQYRIVTSVPYTGKLKYSLKLILSYGLISLFLEKYKGNALSGCILILYFNIQCIILK